MSTTDINKVENEDDNKTLDKLQIEAEEKEMMLKVEHLADDDVELRNDEGPVKTALSGDITEQGREVKPKFIPIGAIKMPGFFTRNSDREKSKEEEAIEKDTDNEKNQDKTDDETKSKQRFQFLQTCPFTKFIKQAPKETDGDNTGQKKRLGIFNFMNPKMFQKRSAGAAEATLASMETLEDKIDTPNDGMENVKLDVADEQDGKVATRLPLKERIRQKKFIIGFRGIMRILDDGVYNFFGIPYATPPVEEKRFTYAQPLNNISMCWNGTLEVHEPGPLCLQFLENGTIIGDEDCLTLDVVTPHVRYDSPLPVVVLIGANTLAGGISPAQPSAMYARTKEVVFVRPNFRLGSFGFLALDILSNSKYPPTSGNYGLSDLLVALKWIQNNIKHFGGDPDSVTLLGHRAGATLTAALTTVLNAHKLYSRVWLSSPSVIFPGKPLEQTQKSNEQFKQISKCNDVDCLRRISQLEILSATPDTWLGSDVSTLPTSDEFKRSWLVLDGQYLRTHAYERWDAQKEAKNIGNEKMFKPIVFGTTQHSGHTELLRMKHLNWTAEIVEKMVNESYLGEKNLTEDVFKIFNKSYSGLVELISSVRTLCPLVSLARMRLSAPLYVALGAGAGGGAMGSGLADIDSDIQAILGTFDSVMPEQRRFMAAIQQLFYYYVWNGKLPGDQHDLIAVGQDFLPHRGLPECDLLIQKDVVPRHAHVD
ncbi:jg8208 [Pararge aegeria aegeria]|uniref:Jg8208 protein n=1 Tax=Pararge aegeria aegeria TaxID=348720 RepID=A0A8S4SGM6_9NEOP|nr:jg8208 [Pararge aegeria aegeria]